MDFKPRDPLPGDALTLPARYYIDPAHFLAERERFFGRMWVFVGREDEMAMLMRRWERARQGDGQFCDDCRRAGVG